MPLNIVACLQCKWHTRSKVGDAKPWVYGRSAYDSQAIAGGEVMSMRMLLVDDSPELLDVMESMYRFKRVDVVGTARGNEEAQDILNKKSVDVISIDIYMGKYCGFDLCRTVRRTLPHVFITMCSGEASVEMKDIASSCGSHYFLEKPIGVENIDALVQTYHEWSGQLIR